MNKKDDFRKRRQDFLNRRKYDTLTLEILASIPDDKIEVAIIDYIGFKIGDDYTRALAIVSNMSDGFQVMYSTWRLEGEVKNGGFNQYFYNSSGQFADMALRSLKLLRATDYAQILRNALSIFVNEKENQILQQLYSQKSLPDFFDSYKYTQLGECDKAFNKLGNQLRELRVKFIREHPALFVGR